MTEKNIALITGGTSGIGLGIARCFAAKGYRLVLVGMEENGEEIADRLAREHHTNILFSKTNVADPAAVEKLCLHLNNGFGIPDILINNAGIQHVSPVEDFPLQKWKDIMDINLNAAFYFTRCLWKHMKEKGWGRIINIASAHGLVASEFKSAYVAAKHGLVGFTKTIALEGAPFGITANAICPGYVKTPLVEKQIADQATAHGIAPEKVVQEIMLVKQPVKAFVPVEAIGDLALYLCSPSAGLITGASLPVEGGWTAQ